MKNLHTVLRQKEEDAKLVRREIDALLIVIPLLGDDEPTIDDVMQLIRLASARTVGEPFDNGMADLETYYPFVGQMGASELITEGPPSVPTCNGN